MVLAKVAPYSPRVFNDLKDDSQDCNSLGLLGVTAYYCWNYTAPLHRDSDRGWSVSVQIEKIANHDEFNFAYVDWGYYLETSTNCVWYVKQLNNNLYDFTIEYIRWFKGEHTHGTIMPRLSSLQNPNTISSGFPFTVPKKSYTKGMEMKFLRRSYQKLKDIWVPSAVF